MKKVFPILIFVFLASCSKGSDCNWGIVEGSRVDSIDDGTTDGTTESKVYYLDIENECTGSILTDIEVTKSVYDEYGTSSGERICNVSGKQLNQLRY